MNMKYINIMVEKEGHQKTVAQLVKGLDTTARMVEEREHGYIIRIGASTNETLQEVQDRSTWL